MKRCAHFIAYLIGLAFLSSAQAADYYWTVQGYSGNFSSPGVACEAKRTAMTSYVSSSYTMMSVDAAMCYGKNQGGSTVQMGQTVRKGDSCPSGSTYNSSNGTCEASNKCAAVKGASTTYTVKASGSSSPPTSVVVNGCAASFGGVMACGNNTKGLYVCTGKLTFSGEAGTSTPNVTAFDCSNVDCSKEKIQPTSSSSPCTYSTSGGTSKCTSSSSTSTPGTTTGTAGSDGKYTFTENPVATSTQTTINTTVVTTSNSGGGSTTVKTDDASITKCVGAAGSCTTQTGTTTSTSSTGSDGKTTDPTVTCTGETCDTDSGTPGTFEGIQPCTDCSWEKSGQRAIKRLKEFGPTDESGNSIGTKAFVSQSFDRFKQTPLVSAVSSISLPDGGGTCPNLHTTVFGVDVGFDSICTLMGKVSEVIAPVMYAFWSLVAVFVFLSA